MRWGDVDYKQLQKLRDNLQKLQDMDLDKFCEDVSKELAALFPAAPGVLPHRGAGDDQGQQPGGQLFGHILTAVSYTHLTLPTKLEV